MLSNSGKSVRKEFYSAFCDQFVPQQELEVIPLALKKLYQEYPWLVPSRNLLEYVNNKLTGIARTDFGIVTGQELSKKKFLKNTHSLNIDLFRDQCLSKLLRALLVNLDKSHSQLDEKELAKKGKEVRVYLSIAVFFLQYRSLFDNPGFMDYETKHAVDDVPIKNNNIHEARPFPAMDEENDTHGENSQLRQQIQALASQLSRVLSRKVFKGLFQHAIEQIGIFTAQKSNGSLWDDTSVPFDPFDCLLCCIKSVFDPAIMLSANTSLSQVEQAKNSPIRPHSQCLQKSKTVSKLTLAEARGQLNGICSIGPWVLYQQGDILDEPTGFLSQVFMNIYLLERKRVDIERKIIVSLTSTTSLVENTKFDLYKILRIFDTQALTVDQVEKLLDYISRIHQDSDFNTKGGATYSNFQKICFSFAVYIEAVLLKNKGVSIDLNESDDFLVQYHEVCGRFGLAHTLNFMVGAAANERILLDVFAKYDPYIILIEQATPANKLVVNQIIERVQQELFNIKARLTPAGIILLLSLLDCIVQHYYQAAFDLLLARHNLVENIDNSLHSDSTTVPEECSQHGGKLLVNDRFYQQPFVQRTAQLVSLLNQLIELEGKPAQSSVDRAYKVPRKRNFPDDSLASIRQFLQENIFNKVAFYELVIQLNTKQCYSKLSAFLSLFGKFIADNGIGNDFLNNSIACLEQFCLPIFNQVLAGIDDSIKDPRNMKDFFERIKNLLDAVMSYISNVLSYQIILADKNLELNFHVQAYNNKAAALSPLLNAIIHNYLAWSHVPVAYNPLEEVKIDQSSEVYPALLKLQACMELYEDPLSHQPTPINILQTPKGKSNRSSLRLSLNFFESSTESNKKNHSSENLSGTDNKVVNSKNP